jgi:predicted CXXCH cytochrome family protein
MRRLRQALVVTAIVVVVVVLAAPSAFANTESGYVTWTAGFPNDTPPLTPHAGYATTTQKCAVCHAVHKAPADGELLLRSAVGDSCVYCHIENPISSKEVYYGSTALYTTEDEHGHQSPAVKCVSCHAVHGANTFKGDKTAKILKVWNIQPSFVEYLSLTNSSTDTSPIINGVGEWPDDGVNNVGWPGWWETVYVQDTAFCSQCHPYYSDAAETTVTAGVTMSDGSVETTSFKTHPLKRPGNEQGNDYFVGFVAQGSTLPTSQSVATHGPRGCGADCHTSPEETPGNSNYPHYNADTARFLVGGPGAWDNKNTVTDSSDDSACLKCHVWRAGDGEQTEDGGAGVSY